MINAVFGNFSIVISVGDFGSILSSRILNEAPEPNVAAGKTSTSKLSVTDIDTDDSHTLRCEVV